MSYSGVLNTRCSFPGFLVFVRGADPCIVMLIMPTIMLAMMLMIVLSLLISMLMMLTITLITSIARTFF